MRTGKLLLKNIVGIVGSIDFFWLKLFIYVCEILEKIIWRVFLNFEHWTNIVHLMVQVCNKITNQRCKNLILFNKIVSKRTYDVSTPTCFDIKEYKKKHKINIQTHTQNLTRHLSSTFFYIFPSKLCVSHMIKTHRCALVMHENQSHQINVQLGLVRLLYYHILRWRHWQSSCNLYIPA